MTNDKTVDAGKMVWERCENSNVNELNLWKSKIDEYGEAMGIKKGSNLYLFVMELIDLHIRAKKQGISAVQLFEMEKPRLAEGGVAHGS